MHVKYRIQLVNSSLLFCIFPFLLHLRFFWPSSFLPTVWLLPARPLQRQTASVPRSEDSPPGPATVPDWEDRSCPQKGMGHALEWWDLVTPFQALTDWINLNHHVWHSFCLWIGTNRLKRCTLTEITTTSALCPVHSLVAPGVRCDWIYLLPYCSPLIAGLG